MDLLKNIQFLIRILWKYNKCYFLVTAFSFFICPILNLVQVVFPKEILVSLEKSDFETSCVVAAAMCIIVLLMNVVLLLIDYKKYSYSGDFEITLNKLLAESASLRSYQDFEVFSFREKYHFASLCVEQQSADTVIHCTASVIGNILSFLSLLYISYMVVWWLWIVIVLSVVVNILCEIYRARYDFQSYGKYSTIDMRMLYARDTLSWKEFAKESRLFHMYDYVSDTANHYINLLANLQKQRAKKTFAAYLISCLFDFFQRIAVFGYIAYQCYIGAISIADFSMLTLSILTISALSINTAKDFVRISEAAKYIKAYADMIQKRDAQNKENLLYNKGNEFKLVFENVSFAYPGSKEMVLKNISYTFDSDKKYGLVGANGSGKTTFVNLLMGMYIPVSGAIFYNNRKITDFSEKSWRELFSAVLQDFNIYAYQVRENVSMFSEKISKQADRQIAAEGNSSVFSEEGRSIKNALERAGIGWIAEDEYLTSEYKQGRELSGGEAQKLAIARAVYKDAKIFVFDEPTAALSPVNEYELYNSICREMNDKMVFFISHRLASCQMCDEILVFHNGGIAESGSHEALLEKKGLYAEMFQAQAYLYNEQEEIR